MHLHPQTSRTDADGTIAGVRLAGKVAIVTGGAQGIGRSYSERFAREGAAVAVVDLREAQAAALAKEIGEAGGRALALPADVTDESAMAGVAEAVSRELGRIDVLVNNAAIYYDIDHTDHSIAYLRKVLEVNLIGGLVCSRAVFPAMKRQRSGSIIHISSGAAHLFPDPDATHDLETIPLSGYGLSKSGVIYATKFMAQAVGRYGIRVNAIAPGVTLSEATRHQKRLDATGPAPESITRGTALGRALEPEDLCGAAVFLASDESALMTGQTLVVDAGRIMLG